MIWDEQCFEYISANHHLIIYLLTLLKYKAVYRTAPATPGLLIIQQLTFEYAQPAPQKLSRPLSLVNAS